MSWGVDRATHDLRGVVIIAALFAFSGLARAQNLTTLLSFGGAQGSGSTNGRLVQGPDGLFYGAVETGGTHHDGAIFKITSGGVLTTLYSFSGADGMFPSSGVTLGPDGNLYGTTYAGGTNASTGYPYSGSSIGQGTIFKITPTGTFTVLHYFKGLDGEGGVAGLTLSHNGNFYGITTNGGTSGDGTIFQVTPSGVLTTLYSFNATGSSFGLTLGPDGDFYGTTNTCCNGGTIFKVTPTGVLTTLYSFSEGNGEYPNSVLTLGPDGNFYGTATSGYENGTNTIFKVTPTGLLTILYSGAFASNPPYLTVTGFTPYGGLTLGPDGNFYGTESFGGPSSDGSIFRVTATGVLTTLYSFSGADGEDANNGLTMGSDGNFYGITLAGGIYNEGTIFSLNVGGLLPSITANGVVNAATYSSPVAPGSIAVAFGAFLLPTPTSSTAFPLPTSISGLSLQFGTLPAVPLFFGSQSQLNLQIPWEFAGQTQTTASLSQNGQTSATQTVPLAKYAPGVFLVNTQAEQGAVLDTSYNLVGPANPTTAGAYVLIYCTGLGPVTNQPATGAPALANPLSWTTTPPTVTIGGAPALVLFSGLVPGEVGLYQVNAQVPAASEKGTVGLSISIGGIPSNTVFLATQ
jgi:uncharacterized protein (TIGR03437 family)